MPLYEYECSNCGVFSALRKISESSLAVMCDECGEMGERIISAPHLAILDKSQRVAHERNEKAANEPRVSRRSSCGCTGSHTCKTTQDKAASAKSGKGVAGKKSDANAPAFQMQTKKTARPWMVGH